MPDYPSTCQDCGLKWVAKGPGAKRCASCAAESKREYMRAYALDPSKKNRRKELSRVRQDARKTTLLRYGLTLEEFESMASEREGRCDICGCAPGLLHVDHDHVNGRVRGLLCNNCNSGMGGFGDSVDLLRQAAFYLARAAVMKCPCQGSHAEANAVLHAGSRPVGATCYVTDAPCPGCTKTLAAAGVVRVVWPDGEGMPADMMLAGRIFTQAPKARPEPAVTVERLSRDEALAERCRLLETFGPSEVFRRRAAAWELSAVERAAFERLEDLNFMLDGPGGVGRSSGPSHGAVERATTDCSRSSS